MQAYHTLVAGDSGGGKTTLMREMHAEYQGLSIWINHNGASNVSGKRVRGPQAARSADRNQLNWITSDPLHAARQAREIGRTYHQETGYPWQVVCDEAQSWALPDGGVEADNPVKRMLHEDRDMACKLVIATQDPQDLDYTPLKQCKYWVWCGPWSNFHRGFLDYFGIPRDTLPTEPYEYVVLDKRGTVQYRGQTQAKYG